MSYTSTTNTSIDTNNTSVGTGIINNENIKNNTDNLMSMFDVNNINVVKKDNQEKDINEADQSIANELSKEIQDTDDEVEHKHDDKSLIPNHSSKKMYASSSSDDSDLIDNINLNNNIKKLQQDEQLNNIDNQSVTGKTDDTFKIMSPKDQLSFNNQYKNISNNSHLITSDIEEEVEKEEEEQQQQQQQQNSSNEDTASILTQEDTSGQQDNKQIPIFDDKISQNNSSSDSTVDQLQQQQKQEKEEKTQVIHTPEQIFLEKKSNINDKLSQSFNKVKKNSINGKKTQKKSSSSGNSNEGPKIVFEKRKISTKPRTHSIQSVLSNVSSRNVLSRHSTHDDANNYNNQERAQSSQAVNGSTINGPIYDMLYNPSQQVQSPAMMTTLKKVRSSIQLNNAPSNLQTNHLASTLSNGHKRQHSLISTFSNNNNNNSSTNLAGLRGSYETDKVLIGERVPFISRDGDSKDLTTTKNSDEENNNNNNNNHNTHNNNNQYANDLHLSKNTLHKTNNEKTQLNDEDVINNDLIEWKNGSVTSMVSGTLTTYRPNRFSNNTNNNFNGNKTGNRTSNGSDVIEDDASDTDAASEKKLTTDALKKLNLLQQQKKNRRKASMISQISTASSIDSPTKLRSYNSFAKRDNDAINEEQRSSVGELMEGENDYEYEDTFGKDISSLSFFGKNIIMDSTIVPRKHSIVPQVNNNSSNTNEKIIFPKKQSIISPETTTTPATKNKKKKQQQIEVPKKPLYTPAVLRDINETKISNDVLVKRALSPSMNHHSNSNNLQQQHSSSNSSSLLETDSVKTMATSTSTWSRLKNLFYQTPSNPDLPQTTTASFNTPKQESITTKHWVPDDSRNACFDCAAKFNLFDRRHHCRHCGEIFCFRHLRRYLYLNSQAHFIIGATGLGRLAKVCDSCLDKYEELLLSGSGSLGVEEEENAQNTGNNTTNGGIENNGGGLPEDWYWSSF